MPHPTNNIANLLLPPGFMLPSVSHPPRPKPHFQLLRPGHLYIPSIPPNRSPFSTLTPVDISLQVWSEHPRHPSTPTQTCHPCFLQTQEIVTRVWHPSLFLSSRQARQVNTCTVCRHHAVSVPKDRVCGICAEWAGYRIRRNREFMRDVKAPVETRRAADGDAAGERRR